MNDLEILEQLIKARAILDEDIIKGKQALTNLIKSIKDDINTMLNDLEKQEVK